MINLLSELRKRLAYTAVAGTALLDEDFRLKRFLDDLAPLAEKNPVLGRIRHSLTALFEAEPAQRGRLLFNLLGLVDAVLYTGAGYGAEGALAALPENPALGKVQDIPHSALSELTEVLTVAETGGWRLICTVKEHPAYLADPRILRLLIGALGSTYDSRAEFAFALLHKLASGQPFEHGEDGDFRLYPLPRLDAKELVFWLKQDFDPAGKTEMTRRLMLVSLLAGAAENDWYLSLLDTAKKDIRAFAVYSLGYKQDNIPFLLELAQKERGRAKEMAYRALALWDTPEVVAFWKKMLRKHAKPAAYLSGTALDVYGDLAAEHLKAALSGVLDAPHITRKQMDDTITPWIKALTGKASAGVLALYDWLLTEQARLPEVQDILLYQRQPQNSPLLPLFEKKLCETLILHCPHKLVAFLEQARETDDKQLFGRAYFLADILTKPAAEFYDRWSGRRDEQMYKWFQYRLRNGNEYCMTIYVDDASLCSFGGYESYARPTREPLDLRWIDCLIADDRETFFQMFSVDLPEASRKQIGAYLYTCALRLGQGEEHYHVLHLKTRLKRLRCYGWQTYDKILVNLCRDQPALTIYQLRGAFACYQAYTDAETAAREAERILEFYRTTPECDISADAVLEMLREYGFCNELGGK